MRVRSFINERHGWHADLTTALHAQCAALGLALVIDNSSADPVAHPDAILYLANDKTTLSASEESEIREHLADERSIIPVIERGDDAKTQLPLGLDALNAFILERHGKAWVDVLVDEILAQAWLARRARSMFISYRRVDSEAMAQQLHTHFVKKGFDVFLDDCSIPRAANFQRELKWRLNDADIVVLLVSPNLESSRWVREEITFASSSSIGLLGVLWPEEIYKTPGAAEPTVAHTLMTDQRYRLAAAELVGDDGKRAKQTLTEEAVRAIEACVAVYRARGIRQRLANLVPYAVDHLSKEFDVAHTTRLGDLELVERRSKAAWLARVLPFRPTPEALYAVYESAQTRSPIPDGVGCFYAENDPHDHRARAMEWVVGATRGSTQPAHRRLWTYTGK